MQIEQSYGVKSSDLDQAGHLISSITGLLPESRDSSDLGGNYIAFRGGEGEDLILVKNRDVYDKDLIFDADPKWLYVLLVESAREESAVLRALDSFPDKLVRLKTIRY